MAGQRTGPRRLKSNEEFGTHKLETFVNGQQLVAWVKGTHPDTTGTFKGGTGDCSVQDDDGKLALSCL